MRTCVSCGDPIPEDKRQDARYCGKSKCRGREYRKRHPKPAAQPKLHEHQASTLLACPCGRRYLLAITELHSDDAAAAQTATPASRTATDADAAALHSALSTQATVAITQTDPQTDPPGITPVKDPAETAQSREAATRAVQLTDLHGSSEANAQSSEAPQGAASKSAVAADAPKTVAQTDSTTAQPAATSLTTLELSFCDVTGRTLGFRDAVARNAAGDWSLRPGARAVFRSQSSDPRCLGGTPGRWKQFYAGRSPTQFGFDADLAVMFWDQRERRGKAASANVLEGILGNDWKDKLRQVRDERLRVAIG